MWHHTLPAPHDAGGCYLYGRSFNPTVRYLGRQLAALEGAEAAYCCSSGETWAGQLGRAGATPKAGAA